MSFSHLGRGGEVEPLLVQLYDSHRLYQLAQEKKPEARAELSQSVVGLLGANLRINEQELVADILISLMRQAERDLRQAIAERLSVMDNVPLRLVLHMAQDEIFVAESVLKTSPVLNDLDLLYIIQSKTAEYWRAIARRDHINEPVIDTLADTRDVETACHLAENTKIALTSYAVNILSDLAKDHKVLAKPLVARSDIPEFVARRLYEVVGEEIKAEIQNVLQAQQPVNDTSRTEQKRHNAEEMAILSSVKDILQEFSQTSASPFYPSNAMLKAARLFKDKGQLTAELMQSTLKRGQLQSFVAQYAVLTGIMIPTALNILSQLNGQALAATLKAFEFDREEFVSIYLMTQKIRVEDGTLRKHEFYDAINYFESLDMPTAVRLLQTYQTSKFQ
jgi:uncharacterized protein (DUF2336 family)